MEHKIISIKKDEKEYPALLGHIPGFPKEIFLRGFLPPENALSLAIVGTRKATAAGRSLAGKIAQELAARKIWIISGLALGIDASAHEGAIKAHGKTLAVLANGLDSIYPAQHENLAGEILKNNGGLLSEYPAGEPSLPYRFLERNRIISGLSSAVIIIEAPEKSGALATARYAAEQGREVFVIPGPADNPNYKGSHSLIRDGARLVTNTRDILDDLDFNEDKDFENKKIYEPKTKNSRMIMDVLSGEGKPVPVDKIISLTTLSPQVVHAELALMIMDGAVKETEIGYVL